MDIPDILKIIIFEDFLKIAKKGPPKDPIGALLGVPTRNLQIADCKIRVD